jgi:D-glycero-D-manno-heptose 1,7-bisphosphate phosphatase
MKHAVFLDRDGVLIEDVHLLTKIEQINILPGVAEALIKLKSAGFLLVVISNQTVVSRGLLSETGVHAINQRIQELLGSKMGPVFDAVYICPHHPNATLAKYRVNCECRKPRPGLFLKAAKEHSIDLSKSFAVGDRITDIIAGAKAGCRTILVETGQHSAPPIQTVEPLDVSVKPDQICPDLLSAVDWILRQI